MSDFWGDGFWADNYWSDSYWPDYVGTTEIPEVLQIIFGGGHLVKAVEATGAFSKEVEGGGHLVKTVECKGGI